jgi:hypothetical protein
MVISSDQYSWGPSFESRPRGRLSWLVFSWFSSWQDI